MEGGPGGVWREVHFMGAPNPITTTRSASGMTCRALQAEVVALNLPLFIKVYEWFNEKFTSSNRRHNREIN